MRHLVAESRIHQSSMGTALAIRCRSYGALRFGSYLLRRRDYIEAGRGSHVHFQRVLVLPDTLYFLGLGRTSRLDAEDYAAFLDP